MAWRLKKKREPTTKGTVLLVVAIAISASSLTHTPQIYAADLIGRSIRVSDDQAAQSSVTYWVAFTTATTAPIGSVRIQFCSNTSLVNDGCIAPSGFDISGASLDVQNGITGFSISGNTTANEMVISRPPASESSVTATYVFSGVTNPVASGSYFARMYTYSTSDGTGPSIDAGGLALYYEPALAVVAEVPPFIEFCVGESIAGTDCDTATEPFSDVGILTPLVTGLAQSQMVAATNGNGGYTMWVMGGTMTSGNNVIPAMSDELSQKGVSQFGINLRANSDPVIGDDPGGPGSSTIDPAYAQPNQFRFQSGDTLASVSDPDDRRKYTVSYVINVGPNQPGGVYATTLTYVVLGNF